MHKSGEDILTVNNFINGEFTPTEEYIPSYDPSTGSVWANIANSSAVDVDAAVQAAAKAFPR